MKTIRGIFIDATAKTITEIQVVDDGGSKTIAKLLRCQWIERVRATNRDDLWIDEEGMLTCPNPQGYINLNGNIFAGNGLILGHDEAGELCGTQLELDLVIKTTTFPDRDEIDDDTLTPSITISEMGPDFQPVPGTSTTYKLPTSEPKGTL